MGPRDTAAGSTDVSVLTVEKQHETGVEVVRKRSIDLDGDGNEAVRNPRETAEEMEGRIV